MSVCAGRPATLPEACAGGKPWATTLADNARPRPPVTPMPLRDLMLALLVCLAWAGNFLTSALALREMPPLLFTGLRLALLALMLGAFLKRPAPGQWPSSAACC